jgi:hypothetical protein
MNTVGLPMPRGTWLLLVVAVLPILVAQVASAAPEYPVEDPQGASYTVAYDPPTQILTLTSSSSSHAGATATPDAPAASVLVEGPNGQVNHGQVMQQLHELTDGSNSGCLTSAVAKSDLGKGGESVSADEIDSLTVDVDCTKTADSAGSDSGKSDEAPGKSDKAPGKGK